MLALGNKIIAGSFKAGASWEVGDVGISAFGIDEALNKRRYLNGQVISQAQFVEFTAMLKSRVSVYPNLATTEVNWQAEVTNSDLGQCGKFVIDDDAGTIRLPKVVNINGLQDLTGLGTIKAESLPNITGDAVLSGTAVTASTSSNGALSHNTASSNRASSFSNQNDVIKISFNASNSSSTYQDDAPVQQEAVQYPYFIQVAEGVESTVDVSREIELNNPFYLGQSMYSPTEPNNASWLKSNGQWNSGATYTSFYNWLLSIYNESITVDGVSVKAVGDGTITEFDYVLDTANTQFKLPTLNGDEDMPSDISTDIKSSLPYTVPQNGFISGSIYAYSISAVHVYRNGILIFRLANNTSGAYLGITDSFSCTKGDIITVSYTGSSRDLENIYFIPAVGNGSLYFYVGETVQDANIIAAAGVLTDVANLKAHYIVETYVNGTSWYRVYSDGWCEQGGISSIGADGSTQTITLLETMSDVNYNILAIQRDGVSGAYTNGIRIVNYTTTSFQINNRTGGTADVYWQACGYIS